MTATVAERAAAASGPKKSEPSRALKFAMVVGGISLALACGEVTSRLVRPPTRGVSWYHYDDRYKFRHRENVDIRTTIWGDGEPWRFRTNSRGFRGASWPDRPPPEAERVLVAGGSFTFGNGVDEDEAYPAIAGVAVSAGAKGKSWEVLNLGVSAWGSNDALAYLETEGTGIGASCLVYSLFLGDEVLTHARDNLYYLEDGKLKTSSVVAKPLTRVELIRSAMRAIPAYDFLLEHSQIFNVFRDAVILRTSKTDAPATPGTPATAGTPAGDRLDAGARASALEMNDAVLSRMDALARDRYGAFAVVLVPMAGDLVPGVRADPGSLSFAEETRAHVKAWGLRNGVPVLDVADELPHDAKSVDAMYFKKDYHLNATGHARVGEALGRRLPELCMSRPTTPAEQPR
jgi:hypothetical protein